MYSYPDLPATLLPDIATARVHPSTWASPVSDPASTHNTQGYDHLGVYRIRPSITTSQSSHPPPSGSYCMAFYPTLLHLLDSHDIPARVARSFFYVASWRHQASLLHPTYSYPLSLAYTSTSGRNATSRTTVACRLPI